MKQFTRGLTVPFLIIGILAILVVGEGIYIYSDRYSAEPVAQNQQSSIGKASQNEGSQNGVEWKTYAGKGFELKYPTGWVIGQGESPIVLKITNPANPGRPDSDTPSDSVLLGHGPCDTSDWKGGLGSAQFKTACISGVTQAFIVHMGATSDASRVIEDQILVSLRFTSLDDGKEKLLQTARQVLSMLNARDFQGLENITSPEGLSLIDYVGWLNLDESIIKKDSISEIPYNSKLYTLGYSDGKGDPVSLTLSAFFEQINKIDYSARQTVVVDEPAPQVSVYATGIQNSIIARVAAGRHFVGFYSEGNPPYPTWNTLYLIFDNINGDYKLRAITKDNWTI
ncbi:MAG: hypothetical protein WCV82_04045 [Candidatus Paceibacterota bacterium]|jgi:hypothetical protein